MNQFTGVSSTFLEADGTPKTCAMSSCDIRGSTSVELLIFRTPHFANQPIELFTDVLPKPQHLLDARRIFGILPHVVAENAPDAQAVGLFWLQLPS